MYESMKIKQVTGESIYAHYPVPMRRIGTIEEESGRIYRKSIRPGCIVLRRLQSLFESRAYSEHVHAEMGEESGKSGAGAGRVA
jgi:hypothetical protein